MVVAADENRARILQVTDPEQALLHKARIGQRFDRRVLVAPPKFLGALRKVLHKEGEKLVADELPKDSSWLNAREIERYFAKESERAP